MIETGLAMELGGTVRITFGEPGLACEMTSNKPLRDFTSLKAARIRLPRSSGTSAFHPVRALVAE
jgi:hypothetical protein